MACFFSAPISKGDNKKKVVQKFAIAQKFH